LRVLGKTHFDLTVMFRRSLRIRNACGESGTR
jgi:hypothetical protein